MGKKKGNSGRGKGSSAQGQGGGSKTLLHGQKQTVTAVDGGEGTPSRRKHDDVNSVQHSQEVRQKQAADSSISGLQVGTWMKHSGESECEELTQDSSISAGCELSDIWNCAKCRVIVKAMIDSHPKKNYYVAKLEKDHITHSVVCHQMSEGPSGGQQSDIQSSDVRSSTENLLLGVQPSELISCRSMEEAEGKEMEVPEERSSAMENQAAEGGQGEEGSWEEDEPGRSAYWQDGNKRRSEDNDSWDRSDNQKGRQDEDNREREEDEPGRSAYWQDGNKRRSEDNHSWDRSANQKGRQDRETGTDNYSRSAGHRGGGGRGMMYKIVKEVDGDLFTAPKECSLAHCVATDMRMGSGIAVSFRQNFKSVGKLLEQGARVGQIAVLEDEGRYIYYLVTKKFSTGKPFFEDLVSSLEKMREHCTEHGVKYLAMPRIGCGLDRLEWRDVKPKIEEIFSGLDISITIYNFNQPEKEDDSQYQRKKRHFQVVHRLNSLVTIEKSTALLFFGCEDGSVDKCGEDLDHKFNFLPEYRKQHKAVGEVIRLEKRNEVLYGLIVRKKLRDKFSYINFENCMYQLRKMVKKDDFFYVGVEGFCESSDFHTMEKVMTVMKNGFTGLDIELHVCWPKELEQYYRENI